MKRRVVVTGLGAITPLGTGVEKSWEALCAGKSGIDVITRFDASKFRTRIGGEVRDFDPLDFIDRKVVRRGDRFIHFALAATRMAMEDARLTVSPENASRFGVSTGTTLGGMATIEENHRLVLQGSGDKVSPFFIPSFLANMASGQIAIQTGASGPNKCSVTACAAGSHAIGDAFKIIQWDFADVMLCGGSEAGITAVMYAGLGAERAMSTRNSEPQKAVRPFDRDRDGFVTSEGSGMIVLEELGHALRRDARIYAEIIGYGFNCDAYHITAPDPDGKGAAACMEMALRDAGISRDGIDYINAHGTSTPLNDATETRAIKSVFRERAKSIPVSSNKSMIGHLWGAAGAVEAIFTVLTITRGIIPATINYETPDPECDLDYVPNIARKAEVNVALSNSFGFGGTNAALVISRFLP